MSIWYRTTKIINDIKIVFSGAGAQSIDGRWHYKGNRAVYCSDSIALATLELLGYHATTVSDFEYHRFSINIPDNLIKEIKINELPNAWDVTPATDNNRDFAEEHLFRKKEYIALALPSVVVPEEHNLIINPMHPEYICVLNSVNYLGFYNSPKRDSMPGRLLK